MDVIPKDKIKAYIFPQLTESEEKSVTDEGNFKTMGYQSSNTVLNMATILILVIALVVVALMIVLSYHLVKRLALAKKIYEFLHKKIFYSAFIRALLKGYLNFSVAAMMGLTTI